ncbi:MAG TPA: FecR domain-containing protein [Polyangiaceae bacterium]|nr:FecR domain-containing protein [Polyangiaceae bacterium]
MKTLRHIEVEPLSEQRWAKIERSVFLSFKPGTQGPIEFQHAPRQNRAYRWGLIAAALTVVCLSAVLALRVGGPPVVAPPSRIITGASASHLALPGVSLDVDPQSAVVVDSEARHGLLVLLDRGSIVCDVAPRSHDAPLIVQAGAVRVRVVGTRFSVTRVGDSAKVSVSHGTVEVSVLGQSRRVQAGEVWQPALPTPEPSADSEAPAPPIESSAQPPRSTTVAAGPRPRTSSSQRRVAPEKSALTSAERQTDAEQKRRSRQSVFEQAAALERRDPARASELYRSLEAEGDSWSQNSLYARGRLSASQGNATQARAVLTRYLERFPHGSNAEDARAVLQRLK